MLFIKTTKHFQWNEYGHYDFVLNMCTKLLELTFCKFAVDLISWFSIYLRNMYLVLYVYVYHVFYGS